MNSFLLAAFTICAVLWFAFLVVPWLLDMAGRAIKRRYGDGERL